MARLGDLAVKFPFGDLDFCAARCPLRAQTMPRFALNTVKFDVEELSFFSKGDCNSGH
jgi:hypothetical protein